MKLRAPLVTVGRWSLFGALSGVVCGVASAAFLWLLDRVTAFRVDHASIVFGLPIAGFAMGVFLERYGRPVAAGTDLVIDTLHEAGPEIPVRMAPIVLFGTVLTHLFGGSVGREGTAVQMGASLTDWISHRCRLDAPLRKELLTAGVAGGFGAVFGTPFAGTLFALELVVVGRVTHRAIVPALIAAFVGDRTTRAFGIAHAHYPTVAGVSVTPILVAKWIGFALVIAAAAAIFIELTHLLKAIGRRVFERLPVRMFVGGLSIVALWMLLGTTDYLGLGMPLLARSFHDPSLSVFAFAWKLVFTAICLGAGFLGGEVTPLFVIGATLGGVVARLLGIPIDLGAGVGMAAAFAAASNTPIALSIMAVELLGLGALPHVAIVCAAAYFATGRRSIYAAQRVVVRGDASGPLRTVALRDLHSPEPRRPRKK